MNEAQKLQQVLDALEVKRAQIIKIAKATASEIADAGLEVTSTLVLNLMRERGVDLTDIDTRFMGCVFRKGWVRVGFTPEGSHCRPVSIWRRK